jgi:tetratricopeptide (TPR) repeat protein
VSTTLAKRHLLSCFIGAMLAAPSVSLAQTPLSVELMGDSEFQILLGLVTTAAQAEDCSKLAALADPALPRLSGRNRNAVQLLRIPCLAKTGQMAKVTEAYRELVASDPKSGLIRSVGVVVALSTGDFIEAGTRLASLADDDPDALNRLTGAAARGITQGLTEQKAFPLRDQLLIALARADWQPRDRPEMRSSLAQGAIGALLSAGHDDEALALLPRVDAPELLADMAMERQYAPIWTAIEARLGANAATAVDRYAAARLDSYTNRPDDDEARRDAVRAFLLLGRYAEGHEIAAPVRIAAAMSEADVASVRYDAQALAAMGKQTEALARLQPFTTIDLNRNPAAAGGLVSLAEMLDESGREEEALALSRRALASDAAAFSVWGSGWLKRTQACALAALGRKADANAVGDLLKREASGNPAAAIETLLCLNRDTEAAALAVETLKTAEGAGLLADQFQPQETLWAPGPSRLRQLWIAFGRRADVKAAFDKAARILPERYWPSRTPRPIPRLARPDDVPVA